MLGRLLHGLIATLITALLLMAIRQTITEFDVDDVEAEVHLDTGMGIGQQYWITAEGEGWEVRRVFWFDSYNEYHAENFVKKLARDEDYRRRCVNRETEWARVSDAVKETERDITRIFRAEHGADTEEVKALVEEVYEAMKGAEPAAFDDIHDRFVSRTEKRVEELKPGPLDPGEEMPFGKHKGRTLIETAREHPGYAEWGVEELDNRPEVQGDLKRALDLVDDDPAGGD